MKDYIVEVKMSETYGISADSPEEAEEKARSKVGNNYLIDEVIVKESDRKNGGEDHVF